MSTLKTCPFCGGEAKLMAYGPEEWACCENCGAATDRDGAWYQRQPIIIDYKEASQKKPRTSIEIGCKVDTKEIDAAVEKVRELGDAIDVVTEKAQAMIERLSNVREATEKADKTEKGGFWVQRDEEEKEIQPK